MRFLKAAGIVDNISSARCKRHKHKQCGGGIYEDEEGNLYVPDGDGGFMPAKVETPVITPADGSKFTGKLTVSISCKTCRNSEDNL